MGIITLPRAAYEHVMEIEDKRERQWTAEAYEILIETYGYPEGISNCEFPGAFIEGFVAAKRANE